MKFIRTKAKIASFSVFLVLMCWGTAFAVPTLQLDIGGGWYDSSLEDIVTASSSFTLYGILTPDSNSTISNTYIMSVAISPQQTTAADLGTFTVNGIPVQVTNGMTYGIPPVTAVDPGGALGPHDIFPTYFREFEFAFSPSNDTATYNTARLPGGPDLSTSGASFFEDWLIDVSGLNAGFFLHFDLYQLGTKSQNGKFGIVEFAPPSHDASTVPEPGTWVLLGSGLVGIAGWGRKRFRK